MNATKLAVLPGPEETWPYGTSLGRASFELRAPFVILAVSFVLHFLWFFRPLSVVFDEAAYGRFALDYLRHDFIFDIHPPLGRLLIWLPAWVLQLNPSFSFDANGLPFPSASYLVLRLMPQVAGTLLPLVVYAVALELGMTRWTALVVGLLIALDNALLVMSRFALPDVFILLFGFAAVWAYLRAEKHGAWVWLTAAAVTAGCAVSVKWTGLAFVGVIMALQAVRFLRDNSWISLEKLMLLCLLPIVVYLCAYAVEFGIANRTSGDVAFMSPQFQASLIGHPTGDPETVALGFLGKFVELNAKQLDFALMNTNSGHPSVSKWYTWPFMMRSVYFWAEGYEADREAHIYLLGNPVIWWTSAYAVLFLLVNLPPKCLAFAETGTFPMERPDAIIVLGYLSNMLPFIVVSRDMFLYHYMPALVFAILAIGLLLDRSGRRVVVGCGLLAAAVCAFVYFAPLSYGVPMAKSSFDGMFWVDGWR